MNTLRIENHIRDYTSWKQAFDKYDALRRDKGVRSYRIARVSDDPLHIFVDLVFDNAAQAADFREALTRIWRTPQSRELQTEHAEPVVLDLLDEVQYLNRSASAVNLATYAGQS